MEWFRPVLTTSIGPYRKLVVVRIRLYTPRPYPREAHQKRLTSVPQHVLSLARFLKMRTSHSLNLGHKAVCHAPEDRLYRTGYPV